MNVWIPLLLSAYVAAAIWITWEVLGRPATATGQRVARGRHLVSVNRQAAGHKEVAAEPPRRAPAEPVEPAEPGPAEPEAPETDEATAEPARLREEPEPVFDPLRESLTGDFADPARLGEEPEPEPVSDPLRAPLLRAEPEPEPVFDPLRESLTGDFADPARLGEEPEPEPVSDPLRAPFLHAEPEPEPVFDPLRDPLTGDFADPALWPGTEQLPRLTDDLLAELDRLHRIRESGGGAALAGGARSAR